MESTCIVPMLTTRLFLRSFALLTVTSLSALAQNDPVVNVPTNNPGPPPTPTSKATPDIAPAWETRALAGSYELNIPAPRGQITDRNGEPLAQCRVGYNLGLTFPTPLNFKDKDIVDYVRKQLTIAKSTIGLELSVDTSNVLKHYRNRGFMPFEIARDLKEERVASLQKSIPPGFVLLPNYFRIYPHNRLAAHVIGYSGRQGRIKTDPLENNEKLWPEIEGREGIEQTFDNQLRGQPGQMRVTFNKDGEKTAENLAFPPNPGYNVVTSIDLNIQRIVEKTLQSSAKRGAIVILDPNNGDILAMASWPSFDPNSFVPVISQEQFDKYNNDPDIPLYPRAFRSAYPPGSTFKVFSGFAALESESITPKSMFGCPAVMVIGNTPMRNHRKTDAGSMNFVDALTTSCNTWFYQVGIKTGSRHLVDYSTRLGFGRRTGIPIGSETDGRVPTDEYMLKVHKRKILNGDLANLSIGQGDLLVSPLQMAQGMMAIANGGTIYQPRLVLQIQTPDNKVINAYGVRAKSKLEIRPDIQTTMRRGMINVVTGRGGTARRAAVPGVQVAGKTGSAQWGPRNRPRVAAWFAGFAPAENPKYAFAAVYEGPPNNRNIAGGTHAAPMIGDVLRQLFKEEKARNKENDEDEKKPKSKRKKRPTPEPEPDLEQTTTAD